MEDQESEAIEYDKQEEDEIRVVFNVVGVVSQD